MHLVLLLHGALSRPGIKLTDIMYELKRLAIKYDSWPHESKNPAMTKIFVDNVHRYGRNYEVGLMAKFMLHKPSLPFKFMGLGWKLVSTGRMPLFAKSIQGHEELAKISKFLESKEVAS